MNGELNFEMRSSRREYAIPLVVHIPHSSKAIPADVRQTLLLDDAGLSHELLYMTDWYTDRLFDPVLELGGTMFVNRLSRLVIDPERFPDDTQEIMAKKGMGAVYTKTAAGRDLRRALSPEDRACLLETYFDPYARAFADEVSQMLDCHGRCVILDGHSFPSVPLRYELDQRTDRPELCIGTDRYHTPEVLVRGIEQVCTAENICTARNRPFQGTYVPLRFWQVDPRVISVMVEVRRDLYMGEKTGQETIGLVRMRRVIGQIIERMVKR